MTDAWSRLLVLDAAIQLRTYARVQQTEKPDIESEHKTLWFVFRTVCVLMSTVCCTDWMLPLDLANEGHNDKTKPDLIPDVFVSVFFLPPSLFL